MIKKFLMGCLAIYLLPVNLSIAANGHDHHLSEIKTTSTQLEKIHFKSLPSVSVRFELQNSTQKTEWFMDRQPNIITTFNGASQQGEIWTRNQNGDIEHSRLFLKEKKLVEYSNGELKTQNKLPKWSHLASIFDPKQIDSLKITGEKLMFGQQVLVLEGKLNKLPTIVWWMPELQLPVYVQQTLGNTQTSIVMKEMFTKAPSSWDWANTENHETYSRLDASDLGDMEGDPFVKKLLELDGHHHH